MVSAAHKQAKLNWMGMGMSVARMRALENWSIMAREFCGLKIRRLLDIDLLEILIHYRNDGSNGWSFVLFKKYSLPARSGDVICKTCFE